MADETGEDRAGAEANRLVELAAGGDHEARQRLLGLYREKLRRMIAVRLDRRIVARVDPSDVVQETLAEAAIGLSDFLRRRPLPFYPWLRQIAWERLIALHRRHLLAAARSVSREEGHRPALPEESALDLAERLVSRADSPSRQAIRAEARSLVREAIELLSPTDREVLVLRHLEGLETAEIAALLGISADAVRARHVRAIEQLRRRIDHTDRSDSS